MSNAVNDISIQERRKDRKELTVTGLSSTVTAARAARNQALTDQQRARELAAADNTHEGIGRCLCIPFGKRSWLKTS